MTANSTSVSIPSSRTCVRDTPSLADHHPASLGPPPFPFPPQPPLPHRPIRIPLTVIHGSQRPSAYAPSRLWSRFPGTKDTSPNIICTRNRIVDRSDTFLIPRTSTTLRGHEVVH
ncbi:hypothetical protein K443DRAFT_8372 [Laccaria amethystina LaAM-08-1]|uniref:Uncharacterized protein n=1 Tax=Laccaria amethystina LaAM-08-1 TaxID=1095629 RepID=A0A0C9XDB8_9AGAR|nr:hypothetical protein K443DRAFT_8372 [Laccaria amethystina LaAM-08-1]